MMLERASNAGAEQCRGWVERAVSGAGMQTIHQACFMISQKKPADQAVEEQQKEQQKGIA